MYICDHDHSKNWPTPFNFAQDLNYHKHQKVICIYHHYHYHHDMMIILFSDEMVSIGFILF